MRTAFVVVALIAAGGCGLSVGPQERPEITYYHLSMPEPEPASAPVPVDLVVTAFAQDAALDRDGILYRKSDVEGGFWLHHRWAQPVEAMVRSAVQRDLSRSGAFRRVLLLDEAGLAEVLVSGEVLRFDEEDREDGWYAVAEIRFGAVRSQRGQTGVILSRHYRSEEKVVGQGVPEVVRALSRATASILTEFREDLVEVLR